MHALSTVYVTRQSIPPAPHACQVAGPLVVKAPEVGATGKTVPRELADFLQYELERVRKECAELSSQLDQRKMEKLFDADKLRECEGRLNVVEAEAVK